MRWWRGETVRRTRWQLRSCARIGDILNWALIGALFGIVALKVAGGVDCATSAAVSRVAVLTAALTKETVARGAAAKQMSSSCMPAWTALIETRVHIGWLRWALRCEVHVRNGRALNFSIRRSCRARSWRKAERWWHRSLHQGVDGLLHCVDDDLLLSLQALLVTSLIEDSPLFLSPAWLSRGWMTRWRGGRRLSRLVLRLLLLRRLLL